MAEKKNKIAPWVLGAGGVILLLLLLRGRQVAGQRGQLPTVTIPGLGPITIPNTGYNVPGLGPLDTSALDHDGCCAGANGGNSGIIQVTPLQLAPPQTFNPQYDLLSPALYRDKLTPTEITFINMGVAEAILDPWIPRGIRVIQRGSRSAEDPDGKPFYFAIG